ncbi:HDIG domain-containing protein [Niameybacter massiliensis]|uniref:HDIG domain-containing protein n=1 Tax=Holtiella tumoricola TaxID=3018743 RepID=A0AA42J2Z1_9FIRM|nr:HDIG domain-containing metalloprotein [Holtiella tumoricola]MDA3733696.1 HDIG domain-containing protein [Holtiella tumoricola]
MKKFRWEVLYCIIAIILTCLVVTSGDCFSKKIKIEVGQIAQQTIEAPFQVENELATERKRILAENTTPDVYKMDDKVLQKGIANIELLFNYVEALKTSGIPEEFGTSPVQILQSKSPIPLYEDEYKNLLGTSLNELDSLEQICINLLTNIMDAGVKENENKSLDIRTKLERTDLSTLQQKIAYEIIYTQIKANFVIDKEATALAKEEARNHVEPIYILQGERVLEQGTRVTEEAYAILNTIGYLSTDDSQNYSQFIGLFVLIFLILLFLYRTIRIDKSIMALTRGQASLIFILYVISLGLIRVMITGDYIYIPLAVAPLLISILISKDIAIVMHLILLVVAGVSHKADLVFMIYHLLSGLLSISIITSMQERKQTMRNALFIGGIQAALFVSLNLLVGMNISSKLLFKGAEAFLVGLIIVILVVGSLPLWEAAFGFITPIQLLELTNPDQPVLKRLLIEATGTYYHSLLVANLAETAADEIGANALMARVGGYYHDIGKLTCSNYFKENQVLDNPHDYLDPKSSADIILSHVTSGLELAEAYKLPKCVKDMIVEHHGTSMAGYFYVKAKNIEGDEVDPMDYSYKGPKPQSREAALIMLADVVEATVRSMQNKIGKELSVEDIVRKMVRQKFDEGQLDECPLYISDLEKIIESFTRMLKGMYHERIEYPDRKVK